MGRCAMPQCQHQGRFTRTLGRGVKKRRRAELVDEAGAPWPFAFQFAQRVMKSLDQALDILGRHANVCLDNWRAVDVSPCA